MLVLDQLSGLAWTSVTSRQYLPTDDDAGPAQQVCLPAESAFRLYKWSRWCCFDIHVHSNCSAVKPPFLPLPVVQRIQSSKTDLH